MLGILGLVFDAIKIWIGLKPDPNLALGRLQGEEQIKEKAHDEAEKILSDQRTLDSDPAAVDQMLKPPADRSGGSRGPLQGIVSSIFKEHDRLNGSGEDPVGKE